MPEDRAGKRIVVVGGGFAGLSSACYLAKAGYSVTLLEKNEQIGGRARLWKKDGYTFDMGPSWYLMPEVFDRFFADIGMKREDLYRTSPLDPSYRVYFEGGQNLDIPRNLEASRKVFQSLESDGAEKLDAYLDQAEFKYRVAMDEFLDKEYRTVFSFLNWKIMTKGLRLGVFRRLDSFVRGYFSDLRARQILEYSMVFLGSSPTNAPALYSLMSHVDLHQGVEFPEGGLGGVAEAMLAAAKRLGVEVRTNSEVLGYEFDRRRVSAVRTATEGIACSAVVFTGDYASGELSVLPRRYRSIPKRRWDRATVAPSMFILYLGIDKKLDSLEHHNLYFSREWENHFDTIFKKPSWPENPCFYLSRISKTDPSFAPEGKENLFLLIPIAAGLEDSDEVRAQYRNLAIAHVEERLGVEIAQYIEVERVFGPRDFAADYHAYRGTALGLSHTLGQTAVFRPSFRSRKLRNLFYSGQYTHPGVGVPMVLIASRIVARIVARVLK